MVLTSSVMATNLAIGDVVQLKSGGPKMTVSRISQSTAEAGKVLVRCVWFLDNGTKQQEVFEGALLEAVKPTQPA